VSLSILLVQYFDQRYAPPVRGGDHRPTIIMGAERSRDEN